MDAREANAGGGGSAAGGPSYTLLQYVTAAGTSSKPLDMRAALSDWATKNDIDLD